LLDSLEDLATVAPALMGSTGFGLFGSVSYSSYQSCQVRGFDPLSVDGMVQYLRI
jgi:hypothetical protein